MKEGRRKLVALRNSKKDNNLHGYEGENSRFDGTDNLESKYDVNKLQMLGEIVSQEDQDRRTNGNRHDRSLKSSI